MKELLATTGYIRGGCSPVGMKKKFPTYFDEVCLLFDEIAISAGERGHQMILPPEDLVRLVDGKLVDLINGWGIYHDGILTYCYNSVEYNIYSEVLTLDEMIELANGVEVSYTK